MRDSISYTTDEIAQLLKISRLTVYDLIKKGELVAFRVGKQMRIDAEDLERYKTQAKTGNAGYFPQIPTPTQMPIESISHPSNPNQSIVITGQDLSLDLLANQLEHVMPEFRFLRAHAGSMDSLISMYQGKSNIVSTHLLDGDTGDYNLPYLRKILISRSYLVVRMHSRSAGLYVPKGNPKQINTWQDLGRQDVKIVNREKGSGARVLLDEQLRLAGISGISLTGYENEESNHLAVASKIAQGKADVGVGIEKVAAMANIDFIPMIQENYDLVMLKTLEHSMMIQQVCAILASSAFQEELHGLGGYDVSCTGHIIYET